MRDRIASRGLKCHDADRISSPSCCHDPVRLP